VNSSVEARTADELGAVLAIVVHRSPCSTYFCDGPSLCEMLVGCSKEMMSMMHIPRTARTRAPWLQSHQTTMEVDSTLGLMQGGEGHWPVPRRESMVAQVGCDEGGEMVEPRNQQAGRQKRIRVQVARERPCRPRVDG
jgi:hypothetical protein